MSLLNSEEFRLQTFRNWPTNAPVSKQTLARCGFYATDAFLEAVCHWCHMSPVLSEWEFGEEVETIHRLASPHCSFITNRDSCGNIPLTNSQEEPQQLQHSTTVPSQPNEPDLFLESNRLATFRNWPNPNISPQSLAKAGFFYLNRSDEVKCAWCQGVIAKWEKQDNAFEEHQRFFPNCTRVQLGPLIELASGGEIGDLGIQQITVPKKPKYSSLDARLRTFAKWPIPNVQQPEALAQAGLYYQDTDDHVRCFHCNIGLRSWQHEDDPWFEHAKWYPQCQFVRLAKGVSYVQEVQTIARQSALQLSQQMQAQQLPPLHQSEMASTAAVVLAMNIEEAMNSTAVRQALEMGIDGGAIRNATQRRLVATGRPYDSVEHLLQAVFGDREDDDDDVPPRGSVGSSIIQKISNALDNILGVATEESAQSTTQNDVAFSLDDFDPSTSTAALAAATPSTITATSSTATATSSTATATVTSPSTTELSNQLLELISKVKPQTTSTANKQQEPSPCSNASFAEEFRKLKDARLCKVCLDEEVGVVFLPCGHLVTCLQCAPGVTQCPMCRTTIKGFVRTFLS